MVNNLKLPFNTTCTCNYCLYLGNHRPFHGFFQLLTGTSENRSLRNTSKLVKDAKFESGFLKLTKIIQLRKDVCRVGGGGQIFAPAPPPSATQRFVEFHDFLQKYLHSLLAYHF